MVKIYENETSPWAEIKSLHAVENSTVQSLEFRVARIPVMKDGHQLNGELTD